MKTPLASDLLEPVRQTFESMVDEDGEAGFNPMITYESKEGPVAVILAGDEGLTVPELVAKTLFLLWKKFGPATWVSYAADAYSKMVPKKEDAEEYEKGQLKKEFEEGDSRVQEMLVVMVMDRDMKYTFASQIHRFIPSEGLEWSEPMLEYDNAGGIVADVIEGFFVFQKAMERL